MEVSVAELDVEIIWFPENFPLGSSAENQMVRNLQKNSVNFKISKD